MYDFIFRLLFIWTSIIWRLNTCDNTGLAIPGPLHGSLVHDIASCTVHVSNQQPTTVDGLTQIIVCLRFRLRNCDVRFTDDFITSRLVDSTRTHYCGIMRAPLPPHTTPPNSGVHVKNTIVYWMGYFVNIHVIYFHMPWTRKCQNHGMVVTGDKSKLFCGSILPWHFISTRKILEVLFYGKVRYFYNARVNIYFHITNKQKDQMQLAICGIFKIHYWYHVKRKDLVPFLNIVGMPSQKIWFHIAAFYEILKNIVVRDGPGEKSPVIVAAMKPAPYNYLEAKYISSAFHIFVRHLVNENIIAHFKAQDTFRTVEVKMLLNKKNIDFKFDKRSKSNVVWIQWYMPGDQLFAPVLEIYSFKFEGPSFIQSDISHGCQYGGVFFTPLDSLTNIETTKFTSICNQPGVTTPHFITTSSSGVMLTGIAFRGYTSWHLKGALIQYNTCKYKSLVKHQVPQSVYIVVSSLCEKIYARPLSSYIITSTLYQHLTLLPSDLFISLLNNAEHSLHFKENISAQTCELKLLLSTADGESLTLSHVFSKLSSTFHFHSMQKILNVTMHIRSCPMHVYILNIQQYICPGHRMAGINSTAIEPGCWTYFNARTIAKFIIFSSKEKGHIRVSYFMCPQKCHTAQVHLKFISRGQNHTTFMYTKRTWTLKDEVNIYFSDMIYPFVVEVHSKMFCQGMGCLVKIEMPQHPSDSKQIEQQVTPSQALLYRTER